MRRIVLALCATLVLAGCSGSQREDLKSPCVGAEESPCGPKRSVNDWWMA